MRRRACCRRYRGWAGVQEDKKHHFIRPLKSPLCLCVFVVLFDNSRLNYANLLTKPQRQRINFIRTWEEHCYHLISYEVLR